jgi:membrane-associated phospholipid phosphatase
LNTALRHLTDCGDTAVTVPLALLLLVFLLLTHQPRLAWGWALAMLGCVATISGLKLMLNVCGPVMAGTLRSPSGHTAISVVVFGAYAAVIGANCRPLGRLMLTTGATVLALGIALSRVVLHFHSGSEIGVGLIIGGVFLAAVHALVAWSRPAPLPLAWLGAATAISFLLFYGERWPAERALHRVAALLDILRPWCT